MDGASYRVTVTLERGSDRPKCQRESKVHPTFECLISMVDKSQSDLVCRCSANGFFSDYRKLHIKMKDLSLKFTTSQPFPPSFTKSFYGIGLSKAQLEQRTFILANWIKEVILLFPKAPESIQKAVMEFFFVHSMNKVEYTNRVFVWLRNMGSTSKNHLSNSHLSLGRSASPLPVSEKPPSPPPMIEKPLLSIPPPELKYSHEVKSCSSSSHLSHHPIIDKEKYFPKLGIRISQLLVFIEQCGGRNVFHNLSTKEVCDLYIKPITAEKELSFCEWLIACNPTSSSGDRSSPVSLPTVSTANVFVSHCWKNKFLDLVDILFEHLPTSSSLPRTRSPSSSPVLSSSSSSPSTLSHRGKEFYVWIDIFSLNQHQSILRYQQESWWQQVLQPAIASFPQMVVILPSWKDCNSIFDRTWCLYELFLYNNNNNGDESTLSFLLSSQEKQSFIQELTTKLDSILPLFDKINIENSQTSLSIDYNTIIHQLRSTISSSSFTTIVNETVQRKIRKWIVDLFNLEILNEKENIQRRFELMKVLGGIYFYYHEINAAENIYQLCINKSIQIYGIEHIYTLHLYHHRSIDYAIKGHNINKGIELMNECYDMKKKYLGEYHLSTMFTYYYIGILYYLDRNRIKGLKIIHLSIQFFKHYLLSLSSSNSSSTSSSASTLLLLSSTSSSGGSGTGDDITTSSFNVLQLIFIPLIEYFKSFKDYDEIEQAGILLFELEQEEYVRYGIHTLQEIYQVQGIPLEKLLEKFKNSSYYNDRLLLVKEILLTPII